MSKSSWGRPRLTGTVTLCAALVTALPLLGQDPLPRATPQAKGLNEAPLVQITELLKEVVADGQIAGAVVGVAQAGSLVYMESVGVQDIETRVPMSDQSLFRMYSMAKSVTSVAAMILRDEGRFDLEDAVSDYMPEFGSVVVLMEDGSTRSPSRPVTVRDLFLHTAGLSHRSSREYREADVRSRDITLSRFIDNITAVPLRSDPGDRYRYSASPTVLGRLIEVWSGQTLDVFMEERVLAPLGMEDTSFWVEPGDQSRLASMYTSADGPLRPYTIEEVPFTTKPALLEGAVGLVSTVPDFLRFSQMLLNGGTLEGQRILSESTVHEMTQNGLSESIMANRRGGSGWALANVSIVVDPSAAEDGANAGEYRWDGSAGTEFWVDPTTETVVVTAWQNAPANPGRLRQRIRALVREAVGG